MDDGTESEQPLTEIASDYLREQVLSVDDQLSTIRVHRQARGTLETELNGRPILTRGGVHLNLEKDSMPSVTLTIMVKDWEFTKD